jgi:hypothetical protein
MDTNPQTPPDQSDPREPKGEPGDFVTKRVLIPALSAFIATVAGVVARWIVPSAPPEFVSSFLDHPAVWAPLLVGLAAIAVSAWRRPRIAARFWPALCAGLAIGLTPGIVLWVVGSSGQGAAGTTVEATARRVSGKYGAQHDFASTIDVTAGDVIEIRLRVSVLETLPARDATVRIELDKIPTVTSDGGTPTSDTPGEMSHGLRVDVLDHPGVYGNGAVIQMVPVHGPVRLRPEGPSTATRMQARTVTATGPAPPWPRLHTFQSFFSSGETDFVANLGDDDALGKITREFTDELITFKVIAEHG